MPMDKRIRVFITQIRYEHSKWVEYPKLYSSQAWAEADIAGRADLNRKPTSAELLQQKRDEMGLNERASVADLTQEQSAEYNEPTRGENNGQQTDDAARPIGRVLPRSGCVLFFSTHFFTL